MFNFNEKFFLLFENVGNFYTPFYAKMYVFMYFKSLFNKCLILMHNYLPSRTFQFQILRVLNRVARTKNLHVVQRNRIYVIK